MFYYIQVHNCTTSRFENKIDCSKLDLNMIKSKYEQATSVEPAIRAAYGFAAVGAKLSNSKDKKIWFVETYDFCVIFYMVYFCRETQSNEKNLREKALKNSSYLKKTTCQ